MADERKAAIDLEAVADRSLDSLSAVEFMGALSRAGTIGVQAMRFWPEKKKYELWSEPENLGKMTIGGLFKGVREKKKIELEKDPRTEVVHKLPGAEFESLTIEDLVINPTFRNLVVSVAREVASQMGARGGR